MKELPCYITKPPVVTVLTATYNRENLLETCIQSVINQSFSDWEHIIIDDGSSDETAALVLSYMKKDKRIRYARHSNRRQSMSLNVGLNMAVGKYTCILDSDDYYLPTHIECRLQYLKNNPTVDFLYGGMKVIGDQFVPDANDPTRKLHVDQCSGTGSFFAQTSVYRTVGGFKDIRLGNDMDLLQKVQDHDFFTRRMTEERYKTYVYVRTEDSVTKQFEREFNSKV